MDLGMLIAGALLIVSIVLALLALASLFVVSQGRRGWPSRMRRTTNQGEQEQR